MSVSGTLSIIVAAVAVILGFLILRDINDDGDASGGGGGGTENTTQTTFPGGADVTTSVPSETTAVPALKPYTVLVANAASVQGAAAAMTTALQGAGVTTLPGTNSTLAGAQTVTTIYYNPGFEAEAAALAAIMGVTTPPEPMPAPPPVADLSTANILVQLGTDKANQPLPAAGAAPTDAATTPST